MTALAEQGNQFHVMPDPKVPRIWYLSVENDGILVADCSLEISQNDMEDLASVLEAVRKTREEAWISAPIERKKLCQDSREK